MRKKFGVESLGIEQHAGILTEQEVRKMIDKGYPISVRYGRGRNSGHFVVIRGYSIINNETIVVYNDPATGEKYEKTYQAFKSYYDDGSMPWTHTVTNWYKIKE